MKMEPPSLLQDGERRQKLTGLLKQEDNLFIYLMSLLARRLAENGFELPKDELTVVDVGAGFMTYGLALEAWAQANSAKPRLVAVDPMYAHTKNFYPKDVLEQSGIAQIASTVEEAKPHLEASGTNDISLITLFNPDPHRRFPDIRKLGRLSESVPVAGAVHAPFDHSTNSLIKGLEGQDYSVQTFGNDASLYLGGKYVHYFDPLFVALPRR